MRVLVTGGAGRLGLKLCRVFLRAGFTVRSLDLDRPDNRRRMRAIDGPIEPVWGDITDPASVRTALDGMEAVVHLAGILPPLTDRNPDLAHTVNVGGTRMLVKELARRGGRIPFVYPSSIVVFGATPDARAPLDPARNPPHPQEPYAETKWECEKLIRDSGVDFVILRLSAAFDLDLSALHLMYRLPLENRFEFCHPDNTVVALMNAVRRFERVRGLTLVIAGGPSQRMSYGRMLAGALATLGLPLPPRERFSSAWYCSDWYDTELSQALLDYQVKDFDDFCRELPRAALGPLGPLLAPLLRRVVGPLFGAWITRRLPWRLTGRSVLPREGGPQ